MTNNMIFEAPGPRLQKYLPKYSPGGLQRPPGRPPGTPLEGDIGLKISSGPPGAIKSIFVGSFFQEGLG